MRLLIFHGYLLRGTGSNVYNAELAEHLVRRGHDVHIFCQDRNAGELGFVDAVGDWDTGELMMHEVSSPSHAGRCTVYRPDIGGLLPVYVYDDYEGFEVKTFDQLTGDELDRYLAANVAAVSEVARLVEIEAGLANHLVMGPVILARAFDSSHLPFAAKIHGSALEYTVKSSYERFAPYAREGLTAARAVLVGSRHTAESLWAAMPLDGLPESTFLAPPGVDTLTFGLRDPDQAAGDLESLVRWLETAERDGFDHEAERRIDQICSPMRADPPRPEQLAEIRSGYDPAGIDVAVPQHLATVDPDGPLVCYVGKLIVSKGVDLLLAAWPLVLARHPRARLVIVGFGTYREGLELLMRGLERDDERLLLQVCREGRELEGGPRDQLTYLRNFLESLEGRHERYFGAARKLRESVVFTGRLEHGELARLLPAADALVVPSMFPEAFGMVAAEAAACGVLPICADHSGLAEVIGIIGERLPLKVRELLAFERSFRAIDDLGYALGRWLDVDPRTRASTRAGLAEVARKNFGWDTVAQHVVDASAGRLARLEPIGGRLPFSAAMDDSSDP